MIGFVLGTRPEVLKLGPVIEKIPAEERCIIWTGQHWSPELAATVMRDASLPTPDRFVQWHGAHPVDGFSRVAYMLNDLGHKLSEGHWKWVVVQGDTDSALAGALAAAKLGIPVFHVEAGCRSGDRRQPEELNRVLIDHAMYMGSCAYGCDLGNLAHEAIFTTLREPALRQAIMSGDTLIDSLVAWREKHPEQDRASDNIVATIHRAETLEDKQALSEIMGFLSELGAGNQGHVVLYVHPHLAQMLERNGIEKPPGVAWVEPLAPSEFRSVLSRARACVTDSGGVATEAARFGVPCLIPRDVTELRDLHACGRVVVGGRTRESLWEHYWECKRDAPLSPEVEAAWSGHASERIAEVLRG